MFKKLKQKISEEQVLPRGAGGRAGSLPAQVLRGGAAGRRVRRSVVGACDRLAAGGAGPRLARGGLGVPRVGPAPPREGRAAQAGPTGGSPGRCQRGAASLELCHLSLLLPIRLLPETLLRFGQFTKAVLWRNVTTSSRLNIQQNETQMCFFFSI